MKFQKQNRKALPCPRDQVNPKTSIIMFAALKASLKYGLFVVVIFIASTVYAQTSQPTKVILDTDIDSDVDDVGALAMLHTLADHNVVDILGVIVTSSDRYAPLCADAINHYYNRPEIPIGVQKGVALSNFSKYTKLISEEYNHSLNSYEEGEDATALYRKQLASQPDSSVIIITIGHLSNLQGLIESGPDEYSDLSGLELIKRKVKLWSAMGGKFPEGKEANFYRPDPKSTKISVENWPADVVFAGWEIGNKIITGGEYVKRSLPEKHPVWRAYQLFNGFEGRQSWDQASILYAVAPSSSYWRLNTEGGVIINEDGSNRWSTEQKQTQAHLTENVNPDEIAKIIDALMVGVYEPKFLE